MTVLVLAHSASGLNFGRSENDIDEGNKLKYMTNPVFFNASLKDDAWLWSVFQ